QAKKVRELNRTAFDSVENALLGKPAMNQYEVAVVVAPLKPLREEVLLLAGQGELPARNVANIGYVLYSDHVLTVELAGTILLVATIGAVLIASRKGKGAVA
ncbi:MAG: NADH-quinone oxidoreductase subunit J family protein, partial [Gemmataceae bacterium]